MNAGEVRVVWRATAALGGADLDAALAVLSDDEREQHRRFHFAGDARDYAAAHALLRASLSSGTTTAPRDWRFARNANGKPTLAGGGEPLPSFSLTHTRGLVACAIGPPGIAVGVDVECDDRNVDERRLASRFFADSEAAALARLAGRSRRERFFDLWTLKEAAVKALGLPLTPSLASLTFQIDEHAAGRDVRVAGPLAAAGTPWTFALLVPAAGYRLAVAAASTTPSAEPLTISCASANQLAAHPID